MTGISNPARRSYWLPARRVRPFGALTLGSGPDPTLPCTNGNSPNGGAVVCEGGLDAGGGAGSCNSGGGAAGRWRAG